MSVDPNQIVTFNKSIVLSYNEGTQQTQNGTIGQLRFNQTTLKFEGYHSNAGSLLGQIWRPLTQDIASSSNLGIIKVGTNLTINPTTGILSSIASGTSRIHALVIEVSPIVGAADYQSINEAISNAIGTPAGGYIDGSITSNLGSPPSPTWPFVIQLGPGNYSEPSNQIILPDYVSLRGEYNYNSVITLNAGSTSNIAAGSLIIAGQNADIRNLAIILNDTSATFFSNGIYISGKSNVVVDNCIITQANTHHTSNLTTCIYMTSGGLTNQITNNRIFINTLYSPTIARTGIYIDNSIPIIKDNQIEIESLCNGTLTGIDITNCYSSQDINTITILESNTINIKNTNTTGTTNQCIKLTNSPANITQCQLESNSPQVMNNNWGIAFSSATPLARVSAPSNFTFGYDSSNDIYTIISSNIGIANFITAGFQVMQHIKVAGSNSNDGYYRIAQVSSTQLALEPYNTLTTETLNSNTITITGLYDIQIESGYIRGNTSSINNIDSNGNYYISLIGTRLEGGASNISPSITLSSGYTVLTVGKENADYPSLSSAIIGLPPSSAIKNATRYKILIRPGIYIEPEQVIFPDNVDIEGDGNDSTIIQTSISSNSSGYLDTTNAGFLLGSNAKVSNITFINAGTSANSNSTSTCLYTNPAGSKHNITLEHIAVQLAGLSMFNYGMTLDTCSNVAITGLTVSSSLVAGNNATLNCCMSVRNSYQSIQLHQLSLTSNNPAAYENLGLQLNDTSAIINNFNINVSSATGTNWGISTYNDQALQSQITNELFSGMVSGQNGVDYSIYNDTYSTIILSGVDINGPTYNSPISSSIACSGCFTTNPNGAGIGTGFQSLSSRGENEQALGTISLGDTAGARGATGIGNVLIGVNAGSNVSTDSRSTVIGANAGAVMSGTSDNTLVGFATGHNITTASNNTALGSNAGASITTGGFNTLIGKDAGTSIITGAGNTMLGYQAGLNQTSGNVNVFIGYEAGVSVVDGDYNVMLGTNAGHSLNVGNYNTILGSSAGFNGTNISGSVLIGSGAGVASQSSNITVIGTAAGQNGTVGINNTILGFQAGYNSNGNANTILGNKSGFCAAASTASCNTLIGNEAGYSLTTGSRNILIGATTDTSGAESQDAAGWSLSSGMDNTLIGCNALADATTGINNVALGNNIGTSITTAGNNVLLGTNAGQNLTSIGNSVMIGTNAGQGNQTGNALLVGYGAGVYNTAQHAMGIGYNAASNVSGNFNTFIGYNSGGLPKVNTTGSNNLAVGPYTGFNLSSGSRNVMVGSGDVSQSVGRQITTGSDNTLLGFKAGRAIQTASNNTLIGSNAGASLSSGVNNLVLGYQAAFNLSTGSYNTVIGPQAGYSMNDASYNISGGYQSAYSQQSGSGNINMGYKAGYTMINQSNNIHIGYLAGYTSTADNNIFLGANAGTQNTVGANNIFMGTAAGAGANTHGTSGQQQGNYNTFLGYYAGNANYSGTKNIFMGYQAGLNSEQGSKNIFIGDNTGSQGDTSHNIFIGTARNDGEGVGYQATTVGGSDPNAGEYNVFVGHDVGIQNTTGYDNVFLGDGAGNANLAGHDNIYMGTQAGYSSNTSGANFNIAIGYQTALNNQAGQENIIIGKGAAGDGTSTNFNQNIIIGTEAGQNIQQNNQIFIGTNAGKNNTTGDRNIFIGLNAGSTNVISQDNIIIGSDAGISLVGASGLGDNVIIGSQAGQDLTSGINNIFIGSNAGTNAISSRNNVVIGTNAMATGDSSNVVIIGNQSGTNNQSDGIIAIGYLAGNANTTGTDNLFIGKNAGQINTLGNNNLFIGIEAGLSNVDGDNNVYVGSFAGLNNNGDSNIAMGVSALQNGINAGINICVGQNAGQYTNSNANIYIGTNAGQNNITGIGNTAIGYLAGNANTLGDGNINIGPYAGQNTTSGLDNINIGSNAGQNSNCSSTIAIGINTGKVNTQDGNVFIGTDAGIGNTSGSDNIFLGSSAGYNNVVGFQNLFIGQQAGYNNSNGQVNIFLGSQSGYHNISGYRNIFIGERAGYENINGYENIFIGENTGNNNTSGKGNLYLGSGTGFSNATGIDNICLGNLAGYNNLSSNNIFIGGSSGSSNTIGTGNIFLGISSGYLNDSGDNNIYFGTNSGKTNSNGNGNICIGNQSGFNNQTELNIFIGYESGYNNTFGTQNLCIGYNSGYNNIDGNQNIFIGTASGYSSNTGSYNVFLGLFSGFTNTSGISNTYIGYVAGYFNDIGSYNVGLGQGAGANITSGSYNICLGGAAGYFIQSGNYNTCIGHRSGWGGGYNNSYIGPFSGQVNYGMNNIFFGYETIDHTNTPYPSPYASFYSNTFAIYNCVGNIAIQSSTTIISPTEYCNILIGGNTITGTVGIGTLDPDSYIGGSISQTNTALVVLGKVLANQYTTFTGVHKITIDNTSNINIFEKGMIVSSTGNVNLIDINNIIVTISLSTISNDKRVFGIYSGYEIITTQTSNIDTFNVNTIIESPTKFGTQNITDIPDTPDLPVNPMSNVSITTTTTQTTNYYVNSLGEGGILVSNYSGEIQNGDYITSCPIPGYGALQSDDILHSYTVAKCTQNIDWSSIAENIECPIDGKMYKSLLVACTYHCG